MTKEHAEKKKPVLEKARDEAWKLLCEDAPAEEAVAKALRIMEESEYFNAGYGGYPNEKGIVLMDAGMMLGSREFASIVNVRRIKYPSAVLLDRLREGKTLMTVWTHEHMQQIDTAPDEVKERYGWVATHEELVSPFVQELLKKQREGELAVDSNLEDPKDDIAVFEPHDTVGCVARDFKDRLCAGTSTGGTGVKANGRVGDSPIIGAGLFADNDICGLSTSGHGESILLSVLSGFVIAEIRQKLRCDEEVFEKDSSLLNSILEKELLEFKRKIPNRGAGIILIPAKGRPAYAYNSKDFCVAVCAGSKERIDFKEAWAFDTPKYLEVQRD
ncbi:MAG: hypothetical protein GYA55_09275 [SAR324 cluster bacterium]|uniref:Asparaginase n=1 Tax=SAR324 cluster bacterium TaxID=2024889 RepID=A0A7X9IKP7_9DELT|nr:hypothetical protein [SAR324 cluster bacterium]